VEELYNVNDMSNPLRDDTFEQSLEKKDVLKNSPSSNDDYIEVPLTVKKESQ
jgi:aspartyl-tRNA(Asn)/glutamyl-tRNA(Gln) amidotransferase subunit C